MDPAEIRAADRQSESVVDSMDTASRRLRKLGVAAKTAKLFTVDGLFDSVLPEESIETQKGAAGDSAAPNT